MRNIKNKIFSLAVVMFFSIFAANATENESVEISYDRNKLKVENISEDTQIVVSNMLGVKLFVGKTSKNNNDEFELALKKGLYIVRIGCCDVRRIVVK